MDSLFLPASSPGAVFRFLERRRRQGSGEGLPAALLLSDAAGPEGLRALRSESEGPADWMREIGPTLSYLFPPRAYLLWRSDDRWGFVVWQDREETESGGGALAPERRRSFWERLPGSRRPLPPDILWARERGLPTDRLQAPVIDYETVARLDQRGLLVENSPRLYRFPL